MFINLMFAKLQTLTLLVIIFEHAFVNCLLIIFTLVRKGIIYNYFEFRKVYPNFVFGGFSTK